MDNDLCLLRRNMNYLLYRSKMISVGRNRRVNKTFEGRLKRMRGKCGLNWLFASLLITEAE